MKKITIGKYIIKDEISEVCAVVREHKTTVIDKSTGLEYNYFNLYLGEDITEEAITMFLRECNIVA